MSTIDVIRRPAARCRRRARAHEVRSARDPHRGARAALPARDTVTHSKTEVRTRSELQRCGGSGEALTQDQLNRYALRLAAFGAKYGDTSCRV